MFYSLQLGLLYNFMTEYNHYNLLIFFPLSVSGLHLLLWLTLNPSHDSLQYTVWMNDYGLKALKN